MITVRPSAERGLADHGWLLARHTFSFAQYRDPRFMNFGPLRVLNQDIIRGGGGFGTHPHDNMEIITWVLRGALEHKDNMGNGSVIRPGDVQFMSAGTGITHSEFNASQSEDCELLQMWILPAHRGNEPRYDQRTFADEQLQGRLQLIASGDSSEDSSENVTDEAITVDQV
jgi:redox-sensitive bicupin YhaK (pirin superfamily)